MCCFPSQLGLPLFSVIPTNSPQVGLKMATNILELIAYQVSNLSVRPKLRWGQFPSDQMGLPEVKTVSSSQPFETKRIRVVAEQMKTVNVHYIYFT